MFVTYPRVRYLSACALPIRMCVTYPRVRAPVTQPRPRRRESPRLPRAAPRHTERARNERRYSKAPGARENEAPGAEPRNQLRSDAT